MRKTNPYFLILVGGLFELLAMNISLRFTYNKIEVRFAVTNNLNLQIMFYLAVI